MRRYLILLIAVALSVTSCFLDDGVIRQDTNGEENSSGDGSQGGGTAPGEVPTVFGLYRANGQSASYLATRDQLGILRAEGKIWFRIISPSTVSMIEFGDIPENAAAGSQFTLVVRISEGGKLASESSVSVKVEAVDGNRLTLKDSDGTYYIVRR